jgi:hypothetical protein
VDWPEPGHTGTVAGATALFVELAPRAAASVVVVIEEDGNESEV